MQAPRQLRQPMAALRRELDSLIGQYRHGTVADCRILEALAHDARRPSFINRKLPRRLMNVRSNIPRPGSGQAENRFSQTRCAPKSFASAYARLWRVRTPLDLIIAANLRWPASLVRSGMSADHRECEVPGVADVDESHGGRRGSVCKRKVGMLVSFHAPASRPAARRNIVEGAAQ